MSAPDPVRLQELAAFYRSQLLDDIVPFWETNALDPEYGGFVTNRDRDGSVFEWDKICLWGNGRMIWAFSHLYNELEPRASWLELAGNGLEFAQTHVLDPSGRAYYSLTRDGRPLEGPRDVFSDLFHIQGFSEYARATGDEALAESAWVWLQRIWVLMQIPGKAHQPLGETMPLRALGHPIIMLNVIDELRRFRDRPQLRAMADECLRLILDVHTNRQRRLTFENVRWDGDPAPAHWGRNVTPGHMIEAGIFIIHEAKWRGDEALTTRGIELIDWGLACGWDKEFGGIYNNIDSEGVPIADTWLYMAPDKMWWQHTEALYGVLLAYVLTGEHRFRESYEQLHEYCFRHFADPEFGEWFGVLDRGGHRVNDGKGYARKSLFHIGRNFLNAHRLAAGRPIWQRA